MSTHEKSAGVILINGIGKTCNILVIKQRMGALWGLPKGHVNDDTEDLKTCAHRELKEETSLDISLLKEGYDYIPLNIHFSNKIVIKQIHFFVYILLRPLSSSILLHNNSEISHVSWFNPYINIIYNVNYVVNTNRTLTATSVYQLKRLCSIAHKQLQQRQQQKKKLFSQNINSRAKYLLGLDIYSKDT